MMASSAIYDFAAARRQKLEVRVVDLLRSEPLELYEGAHVCPPQPLHRCKPLVV
jgi:hypothetical protein